MNTKELLDKLREIKKKQRRIEICASCIALL